MQICQECHVGKMLLRKISYLKWYDNGLPVVYRIPALICDTCGEKSYDAQALDNLYLLLQSAPNRPVSAISRSN